MHNFVRAALLLSLVACDCESSAPADAAADVIDVGPRLDQGPGSDAASGGETECADGLDNDGDGRVDCGDFDCRGTEACPFSDEGCVVRGELDGTLPCEERAAPGSFSPSLQWSWDGPRDDPQSVGVIPLVANFTDDDGNGTIDLCDTPDVVIVVYHQTFGARRAGEAGEIVVLDGATGTEHFRFGGVDASVTPAIGDIDNDGRVEIVSVNEEGRFVAFEHDGTLKWTGPGPWEQFNSEAPLRGSLAIADVDNDGDAEVLGGNMLVDHEGNELWTAPEVASRFPVPTMADLDGDGDLEIVLGNAAYQHDGTEYFVADGVPPGLPSIANLDDDPEPEILLATREGVYMLEHDGAVAYGPVTPTGSPAERLNWIRPIAVHDFDGDGEAEFAMSSAGQYSAFEGDATVTWSAPVEDVTGIAGGTAFDFLGDGTAEAMYADEVASYIFGASGEVLLQTARTSDTFIEYPVVADVDNDGSAEIIVVSDLVGSSRNTPAVQVIGDAENRWIQARRIWNQHTYHVTNVREDGTIPAAEQPNWRTLNTFRTNAQISGGLVCEPPLI
ncbi:MAG: FG-GAP-like repeat-containing protein [Polyangiales bacterium]